MRASLSKVAVVGGLLLIASGCGGGGGGGDETGGSGGGGTGGSGTGGHGTGGIGTGGIGTGGIGTGGIASGGIGGHANGGSGGTAGATGLAGGSGAAGTSGGTGGGAAGSSGTGGGAAGSPGTGGGAAGASGGAAGGGAAGSSGNGGATGGAAGGSVAGASGGGGAAGGAAAGANGQGGAAGGSTAGASGSAGAGGHAGATGGAAGGAAAGASGSAGSSGAAGAGGAAGSGATATLIQNIQDGTIATGAVVSLSNVFVTAVEVASGSNGTTLYIQEPEGITTTGRTYPQYAGVEAFVTGSEAGALPALATISVGDCVSLTGTTSEFQSAITEIVTLTALSRNADAASCGTFPTPLAVPSTLASFADLATDTSTAAGDTAGAKAEIFEDVLVTFSNVQVVSTTATQFRVSTTATVVPSLLVDPFLYSFTVPASGMTYTHVAGVYTQSGIGGATPTFRLQPRSAADLVH